MAVATATAYAVPSGSTCRGGRAAAGLPAWVAALPLWHLYEIPNTALSSVAPSPTPPGQSGPSSKINAWCGATVRRLGSEYKLGAAGGHSDYLGNEVDTLGLNVETPGWVQTRAPSLTADMIQRTAVYLDGRRSALHTYYATQYDNINDRMLIVSSGVPFDCVGVPNAPADYAYPILTPLMMAFDRAANDWLPPDTLPRFPWGATGSGDLVCTDPATNDIYVNHDQNGSLWRYRPVLGGPGAWVNVGAWFLNGVYASSAIDSGRDRMLVVGDYGGVRAPFFRSIINASAVSATFGGLGAAALTLGPGTATVYDEANDCFIVAKNNATIDFYRVDAATFFVDKPTLTGAPLAPRPNSLANSLQYVPELRGVVIANSYTGNVKFMRTHL